MSDLVSPSHAAINAPDRVKFAGLPRGLRRLVVPILLVVAWQATSSLGLVSTRIVAGPATILATGWDMTVSGVLPHHLAVSLLRVLVGLAIAISLGTILALVTGLSRRGEDALDGMLQMLRTLPYLALVPLLILWCGIGETPKIVLVAFGAVFPIYINLFAGIRGVDPKLIEVATTLRLSRWETIRYVILPSALPQALVGLRYAIGVAWISLVVGEQINADSGIGYLMMDARDFLRTDVILLGLLVYGLLGLGGDQLVRGLESVALRWRPLARVSR